MQKVKEKSNWKGETIVEIEIERLKAFRNHPFQVRDDDDLEKLKESIKMYGILTPLLVRPIKDGTYEIISGHRRKRAAALLGYRKIPVLIQPMSYEDAVVKMADTNLHREHISFSEKAFAYRMKNEAMKQKVGRKKGQSGQQKKGKKTIELIGEEFGDSPKQVQRYIAVTRLIPELLQKLDRGEISFNPSLKTIFRYISNRYPFIVTTATNTTNKTAKATKGRTVIIICEILCLFISFFFSFSVLTMNLLISYIQLHLHLSDFHYA